MDAHLPASLWWIALFGGIGAFIDFLIGRAGQDRTRGFLETWWIRFDDVHWTNFGKKEALFAVNLLDRWCGKRLFSVRRGIFVLGFFTVSIFVGHTTALIRSHDRMFLPKLMQYPFDLASTRAMVSVLGLAAALSATRLISVAVARLSANTPWENGGIFTLLLAFNYMLLGVWSPITDYVSMIFSLVAFNLISGGGIQSLWTALGALGEGLISLAKRDLVQALSPTEIFDGIYHLVDYTQIPEEYFGLEVFRASARYASSLLRFAIALTFVGSFVIRPFLIRPLSLVWRRVVESEKPVFTLVFGGISAGVVLVTEITKHL